MSADVSAYILVCVICVDQLAASEEGVPTAAYDPEDPLQPVISIVFLALACTGTRSRGFQELHSKTRLQARECQYKRHAPLTQILVVFEAGLERTPLSSSLEMPKQAERVGAGWVKLEKMAQTLGKTLQEVQAAWQPRKEELALRPPDTAADVSQTWGAPPQGRVAGV